MIGERVARWRPSKADQARDLVKPDDRARDLRIAREVQAIFSEAQRKPRCK